jgi:hypothetical protein
MGGAGWMVFGRQNAGGGFDLSSPDWKTTVLEIAQISFIPTSLLRFC